MDVTSETETGEYLIRVLGDLGVEYVFSTFGTDHPTLIKGLARDDTPQPILASHEMVAASAAHGYAQATGTPGVVLVHVDVGTANLGASLHNANRSRVPVVVLAGRTPLSSTGVTPGSRSIFVHWYQDVADQASIVREYTKWEDELVMPETTTQTITRGLDIAQTAPEGPVYLSLPREVLRKPAVEGTAKTPPKNANITVDSTYQDSIVSVIRNAEHPLLLTSYLGRDPSAVPILETFAETAGVGVVEVAPAFDLNFPRDHDLHHGFLTEPHLDRADVLIIAACDVPWVPKNGEPSEDTQIIHIDTDPTKSKYPKWYYHVDHRVRADPASVLTTLTEEIEPDDTATRRERLENRGRELRESQITQLEQESTGDITPALLSRTISEVLSSDAIVVDETVTNTVSVLRYCMRTQPGTYYSYCSSGLGWGLGASLGIKLANRNTLVSCVIGDGSFVLGNPIAAIQMAEKYDLPFLTVIYNNDGWKAVSDAIYDEYPEPSFAPESFAQFETDTPYAAVASGLGCYGATVTSPEDLRYELEQAVSAVNEGSCSIIDVSIADPHSHP